MQRAADVRENAPVFAAPELAIPSQAWQTAKPFVHGGISGMAAWMFVQPADIVKVRIQLGTVKSPVLHSYSSNLKLPQLLVGHQSKKLCPKNV